MSQAEENFMNTRSKMEDAIRTFYNSCQEIDIDNEGFAEDVVQVVDDATGGEVIFDPWYE